MKVSSEMNKSLAILDEMLLVDSDGNKAKIILVEGAEKGNDCLVIHTQSKEQKESDTKTQLRIYNTEI